MKGLVCCVVHVCAHSCLWYPEQPITCQENGLGDRQKKKWRKRKEGKIGRVEAGNCTRVWLWAVGWWREALHAHLEQLEQLHLKRRAISWSLCRHFLFLAGALSPPPFFLLLSLNLSLCGLRLLERWNGYPLSISKEELVKRSKKEERTLTWERVICHKLREVDNLIMSSREEERELKDFTKNRGMEEERVWKTGKRVD